MANEVFFSFSAAVMFRDKGMYVNDVVDPVAARKANSRVRFDVVTVRERSIVRERNTVRAPDEAQWIQDRIKLRNGGIHRS